MAHRLSPDHADRQLSTHPEHLTAPAMVTLITARSRYTTDMDTTDTRGRDRGDQAGGRHTRARHEARAPRRVRQLVPGRCDLDDGRRQAPRRSARWGTKGHRCTSWPRKTVNGAWSPPKTPTCSNHDRRVSASTDHTAVSAISVSRQTERVEPEHLAPGISRRSATSRLQPGTGPDEAWSTRRPRTAATPVARGVSVSPGSGSGLGRLFLESLPLTGSCGKTGRLVDARLRNGLHSRGARCSG